MTQRLRILSATLVIAALALAGTPAGANGDPVPTTGSVTPTTVDPGGTLTVTFESDGPTNVCDDQGPEVSGDTYTYEGFPLVFGLFPSSVTLDPEGWPEPWYNDGTPLNEIGSAASLGTLATSTYDYVVTGNSGWQGSFTGQFTVPADLPGGTYNAVWTCGDQDPGSLGYDTQVPPRTQQITVTGTPDPGPAPADDGISLTLDFEVGDNIRAGDAGVPVAGSGLQPGADYIVVLRSDPVEIGAGVNDANGAFSAVYPVPADTPAGPHSVTVTSLNTAGQEVSAVAWFTLDANGTVTAISYEGPTAAAASPSYTG